MRKRKLMYKMITILILCITICTHYITSYAIELSLNVDTSNNNVKLSWTGNNTNKGYRIFKKKQGSNNFQLMRLTDFNNDTTNEEIRVLNVYPTGESVDLGMKSYEPSVGEIPKATVTYRDGRTETIDRSALLKVWMEGRKSK